MSTSIAGSVNCNHVEG